MNIKEQAYKLHLEGMSYSKIAIAIGTVKSTAHDYVKEIERNLNGIQLSTSKVRSSRKRIHDAKIPIDATMQSKGLKEAPQSQLLNNVSEGLANPTETESLNKENMSINSKNSLGFKLPLPIIKNERQKVVEEFMEKSRQKAKDENLKMLGSALQKVTKKEGLIAAGIIAGGTILYNLFTPKKKDDENPDDEK